MRAIDRYTTQIEPGKIEIYSGINPKYYKNEEGRFESIDESAFEIKSNSNISSFELYSKNVLSVGIRQDNNTSKYIGIRPDETQHLGSQQMEWSLDTINVNGNNISPDLSKYEKYATTKNLGNISIQNTKTFVRQMVNYDEEIKNFKINYTLHLKGLKIKNDKYTETTIIRNNISSSLIDCGIVSAENYSSKLSLQQHSQSSNSISCKR